MTATRLLLRCELCEGARVAEATVVRYLHPALPASSPGWRIEIRQSVPTCAAHRDDVAFRVAWNVYQRHVAPELERLKLAWPSEWRVEWSDGAETGGEFSLLPEALA